VDSGACPFCSLRTESIFHAGRLVVGVWDAFPVSAGHALLIPKRHVATWFDATDDERQELTSAIAIARAAIEEKHRPDGYNIGINVGAAAGQTVFHLHVHVIPRQEGDVVDPRGGVRHVVPARGNYLTSKSAVSGRLIRGLRDPFLAEMTDRLAKAVQLDMAVAFAQKTGVRALQPHFVDLLARRGRVRAVIGDYLDITEPDALRLLLDLASAPEVRPRVELRVFQTVGAGKVGYHPKGYVLYAAPGEGVTAYVGSSNLSASAFGENVEWNFRIVEPGGIRSVRDAFEDLFRHPATVPLTEEWIDAYEARRRSRPLPEDASAGRRQSQHPPSEHPDVEPEEVEPPPTPHEIQEEALAALAATRAENNAAGLVVLATGLGKTWLAAFDTERAKAQRVLFVAHREEILSQAMETFRRIHPKARFGYFTGREHSGDAQFVFASIQTLSKKEHLERFGRDAFDYVIVDEFHHASARTYREVIAWFAPRFMLGLSATPERTDGGDLLALCGENLVYRCDLARGIEKGLLSPFEYFGVPDDVDYENIPWRSTRFDEEALTNAVATEKRAANALEQWRKHKGTRTIAFCVSQRHADFMARYFRDAGVRAVAVHTGPSSAPRAVSLSELERGQLDVVFAVDLFNEGVDVPHIDTVLMLRPTESRILFLQQLGRGLRRLEDKRLKVVDYIGNHRIFLTKVKALLNLDPGDSAIAVALRQVARGEFELPEGCSVTYDLEARRILESLLREPQGAEQLRTWYEQFKELHGTRPTAVEAMHEGYTPRAARTHYGSWLGFVESMGDLTPSERAAKSEARDFLSALETTPMTRTYKMLVLQAMLNEGQFPGEMRVEALAEAFARAASRSAKLRADVSVDMDDRAALRRLIEENPIRAWTGGKGTGDIAFFAYAGGVFRSLLKVSPESREAVTDLTREIADWRIADFLVRNGAEEGVAHLRASHNASGQPILFMDRMKNPDLPEGWTRVKADGKEYDLNFVKTAVNVARRPNEEENVLPELLRGWFGPNAGKSGTAQFVLAEKSDLGWNMRPRDAFDARVKVTRLQRYRREEIPPLFGTQARGRIWDQGFIRDGGHIFLLVTLDKSDLPKEHAYGDRFLSDRAFEWQSQNRMRRDMPMSVELRDHATRNIPVHLFVRPKAKIAGKGAPFLYLGEVDFRKWRKDNPITVDFELKEPVPKALWRELGILET
jgi:superfamily II DNA or RNA helicase/diadenosine tetraphosphate (Ap4A) HIT family hydrolase